MNVECPKCHGNGSVWQYNEFEAWKEVCETCNGKGSLKRVIVDDIAIAINEEMVYITKKEYNELLEYKYMYERLCE